MTEWPSRRQRAGRLRLGAALWPVAVLAALLLGLVVERLADPGGLELSNPDRSALSGVRAALAGLPDEPLVLVGMDADLGTYPEIMPAVRAALDDLLARDARLAFVSFTPEGRAVAAAELARLREAGTSDERLVDIGFVAGAEAGLVLSVTDLVAADSAHPLEREVRRRGDGIAAFDAALLVGGVDFGPRSWVEQVATRLPDLPLVAVAPTFAHPELAPYLRTGQLDALLATVRDDARYVSHVEDRVNEAATPPGQRSLAMLAGMLIALGGIGLALYRGNLLPPVEPHAEGEEAA